MGRRNKLQAKEDIKMFPDTIFQDGDRCFNFINKKKNLIVEIGMGGGLFINQFALDFKDYNFLGLEVKEERCLRAIKKRVNNKLDNMWVICARFQDFQEYLVKLDCLQEVWITFPDPWPKSKHEKNRFINIYNIDYWVRLLKERGIDLYFKTDCLHLFEYTVELFEEKNISFKLITRDLHNEDFPFLYISEFEQKFLKENKEINLFMV